MDEVYPQIFEGERRLWPPAEAQSEASVRAAASGQPIGGLLLRFDRAFDAPPLVLPSWRFSESLSSPGAACISGIPLLTMCDGSVRHVTSDWLGLPLPTAGAVELKPRRLSYPWRQLRGNDATKLRNYPVVDRILYLDISATDFEVCLATFLERFSRLEAVGIERIHDRLAQDFPDIARLVPAELYARHVIANDGSITVPGGTIIGRCAGATGDAHSFAHLLFRGDSGDHLSPNEYILEALRDGPASYLIGSALGMLTSQLEENNDNTLVSGLAVEYDTYAGTAYPALYGPPLLETPSLSSARRYCNLLTPPLTDGLVVAGTIVRPRDTAERRHLFDEHVMSDYPAGTPQKRKRHLNWSHDSVWHFGDHTASDAQSGARKAPSKCRRPWEITGIVLHWTGRDNPVHERAPLVFRNNTNGVASQFLIESDGTVAQFADAVELTTHAGNVGDNTVGIETANIGPGRRPPQTDELYTKTVLGTGPGWVFYRPTSEIRKSCYALVALLLSPEVPIIVPAVWPQLDPHAWPTSWRRAAPTTWGHLVAEWNSMTFPVARLPEPGDENDQTEFSPPQDDGHIIFGSDAGDVSGRILWHLQRGATNEEDHEMIYQQNMTEGITAHAAHGSGSRLDGSFLAPYCLFRHLGEDDASANDLTDMLLNGDWGEREQTSKNAFVSLPKDVIECIFPENRIE